MEEKTDSLPWPNPYVDYRCEDRRKVGELRGGIGAIGYALIPSFRKP
jgi:hypothetical protein